MGSLGCKISGSWLLGLSIFFYATGLQASDVLKLRDCGSTSRHRDTPQMASSGSLVDLSFQSKVELLYPVVEIQWIDTSGKILREEQKVDEFRGGQNFLTLAVPSVLKPAAVKILINDQHCYQAALRIESSTALVAQALPADSKFFSLRPEVNQYSMLGLSLLISFALLALVPKRKTYFLTRKLALPE